MQNNPDPDVVALLLHRGADVNAKTDEGNTPLHLTLTPEPRPAGVEWRPDPEVVVLLLDWGADVHAGDWLGITPCDLAEGYEISIAPHILDRLCVASVPPTPAPSPTPTPPLTEPSDENDREVLIALFNATNGENWHNNDNWLTDRPLYDWHGVDPYGAGGRVTALRLNDNGLTGEIPPELGSLASMGFLYLAGNQLTGEIPPELGNLTNLRELYLNSNRLTGEIPPELGNLTNLEALGLSHNRLRGEFPSWLEKLPLEFLMLSGNLLEGCASTSVINELGPGDDKDLQLNGHYCFAGPPQGVGQTFPADASTSAATDREALASLYHATNGQGWSSSLNWLSDAPLGQWEGVYTNQDGRVVALHLGVNGLEGEIPPELGDLAFLDELELPYNELRGEIPPELGNLPRLRHLNLFENDIGGEIPPELGRLANLVSLHLSYNGLEGVIPRELGDLANLEILTLQGNGLSGSIPLELGAASSLRHLGLESDVRMGPPTPSTATDSNGLGGCIPDRLYRQLNLVTSRLGEISPC